MGARLNPGPSPDPNALRRRRPDDNASWTNLPATGLAGDIPDWPITIEPATMAENQMWNDLWRKQPQAHIWLTLGLEIAVATYVRTALYAASPGARATYLTAVRQQADSLLLTPAALRGSRYRIRIEIETPPADPDAPAAPVVAMVPRRGSGVLGRLGSAVASKPEPDDDEDDDESEGSTDDD
jgi:hypothetical protein